MSQNGWGGARPNSGPKRTVPQRRSEAGRPLRAQTKLTPARANVDWLGAAHAVAEALQQGSRRSVTVDGRSNPFQVAQHPPAVTPPSRAHRMAMDDNINWAAAAWDGAFMGATVNEGLLFLGYPYLAELAQRPEYRVISDTLATEMTRKWIKLRATGDQSDDDDDKAAGPDPDGAERVEPEPSRADARAKASRIKAIEDELERLQVRDRFCDLAAQDGYFGRSHLYLDYGHNIDDREQAGELAISIGDGRDRRSQTLIGNAKRKLREVRTVEAVWTYPMGYNAINPLRPNWYAPQTWYVMGQEIHASRLLTFVGRPVPDMLKPAYSFGGLSMSQLAKPYVDIWLTTRQSIADLIHAFSVMVLCTDLSTMMQDASDSSSLMGRVTLFNNMRDNKGLMVLNKNTEDFKNVSASLAGLHELQAQAQEHMASVARIPLVKFTGISPSGLNASSEGEMRAFYDTIAAMQNRFFRPNLNRVINLIQLGLFGEIDPEITYDFVPLWELTEKERAEQRKADAETAQVHIDSGVLSPEEERRRIANDPDSPYSGLDPDDVPDLLDEEAQGLEPEGGRPQPAAGPPGGAAGTGSGEKEGGAGDAVLPFVGDAEWNESDHPRADNGQFGSGGASANIGAPLSAKGLKKVGGAKGSNPGGVYRDAGGTSYYVKQGQSKDHVRNEMLAASLYGLAGSPTLKYRPVEGGAHVATEMAKLDKTHSHQLSPDEIAKAREDFATHAWTANWDAVGTGGDNLGTVAGVPTALDLGGALEYRAQGSPKGSAFGTDVPEIDSLRNASINPYSAQVFGGMTDEELRRSGEKVTAISDADIRRAVDANGGSSALAEKLIARKQAIMKRLGSAPLQSGSPWEGKSGEFKKGPSGNLAAQGFAPKKGSGKASDITESTRVAWAWAQKTGKPATLVTNGHNTGFVLVKPGEKIPYGVSHIVVTPDGTVTQYHPMWAKESTADDAQFEESKHPRDKDGQFAKGSGGGGSTAAQGGGAATPSPSTSPAQKQAPYGGLYVTTGSSPKENHALTVAKVLAGKPQMGIHYRRMLDKLIKEAPSFGGESALPGLKSKLASAYVLTHNKLLKQAQAATSDADKAKYQKLAAEAEKKIQKLGAPPPPGAGQAAPSTGPTAVYPTPSPAEAAKAAKTTPIPQTTQSLASPKAKAAIEAFNEKWAGKPVTEKNVGEKVENYKTAMAVVGAAATQAKAKQEAKTLDESNISELLVGMGPHDKKDMEALTILCHGKMPNMVNFALGKASQAQLELDKAEATAISMYSGETYRDVNEQLRNHQMTPAVFRYSKVLNRALDKLPDYKGEVYRKTDLPDVVASKYVPGMVVPEIGFTSTSKKPGIWSGDYHYVIHSKTGKDIEKMSFHGNSEAEVLFKSGTYFVVKKIDGKKIHIEEVE